MLSSRLTTELDNYGSRAAAIKITENHVLWAWRAVGYVMGVRNFAPEVAEWVYLNNSATSVVNYAWEVHLSWGIKSSHPSPLPEGYCNSMSFGHGY